jgi:hypothetical protein
MPALTLSAYGRALLDDHAGAFARRGRSGQLAEQLRFVAEAVVAVGMLARQSAARGMHDEARRQLERARVLVGVACRDLHEKTPRRPNWTRPARSSPSSARSPT